MKEIALQNEGCKASIVEYNYICYCPNNQFKPTIYIILVMKVYSTNNLTVCSFQNNRHFFHNYICFEIRFSIYPWKYKSCLFFSVIISSVQLLNERGYGLNFFSELVFISFRSFNCNHKIYWNANCKWGEIKLKLHFDIFLSRTKATFTQNLKGKKVIKQPEDNCTHLKTILLFPQI